MVIRKTGCKADGSRADWATVCGCSVAKFNENAAHLGFDVSLSVGESAPYRTGHLWWKRWLTCPVPSLNLRGDFDIDSFSYWA